MVSLKSTNRQTYFDKPETSDTYRMYYVRQFFELLDKVWFGFEDPPFLSLSFSFSIYFFSISIFLNLKILSVTGGEWKLI
jgi:hypothetical protein